MSPALDRLPLDRASRALAAMQTRTQAVPYGDNIVLSESRLDALVLPGVASVPGAPRRLMLGILARHSSIRRNRVLVVEAMLAMLAEAAADASMQSDPNEPASGIR